MSRLTETIPNPLLRFLAIQIAIFGGVGILSLLGVVDYSTGLWLAGILLLVVYYVRAVRNPNSARARLRRRMRGEPEPEQSDDDAPERPLVDPLILIALVPFVGGITVSLL
jgi:hypothetical protein